MTFSDNELIKIASTDFYNDNVFLDVDCFNDCYIYPICPTCAGANFLNYKAFNKRDKRRCRIQQIIALFSADLQAKRIVKNPEAFKDENTYKTIEAIKRIKQLYLPYFERFL